MFKSLALALIVWAGLARAEPALVFSAKLTLSQGGGFSGIELRQNGQSGIVVSDRGALYAIGLERLDGVLSTVTLSPWPARARIEGDIEGIASNDWKTIYFSLEKPARVIALSGKGDIRTLPQHSGFDAMEWNKGLEALAIDPAGNLFTLPESPANAAKGQFADPRGFRFVAGQWFRGMTIARNWPFQPVGADFGPDGKLYLLERALRPLGFRSRVRRFDPEHPTMNGEILLETWPSEYDNLEGISLWQDEAGRIRATLIADNNFNRLQRNQIVEFILQE